MTSRARHESHHRYRIGEVRRRWDDDESGRATRHRTQTRFPSSLGGVTIQPGDPYIVNSNAIETVFRCPFISESVSEPGGAQAAICLDAKAISLLEGSLGGDGSDPPKLNPKG